MNLCCQLGTNLFRASFWNLFKCLPSLSQLSHRLEERAVPTPHGQTLHRLLPPDSILYTFIPYTFNTYLFMPYALCLMPQHSCHAMPCHAMHTSMLFPLPSPSFSFPLSVLLFSFLFFFLQFKFITNHSKDKKDLK